MGKKLEPVWDEILREGVAWRLENLNDRFEFANRTGEPPDVFEWRAWTPPNETWDHDHCDGCWAKFMKDGADATLSHGWVLVAGPNLKPTEDWICDHCHRLLGAATSGNLAMSWIEQ